MFTGIIEGLVKISYLEPNLIDQSITWSIEYEYSNELVIGESISLDGICHTVTSINQHSFGVLSSSQTIALTTLKHKNIGDTFNLERSLKLGDRLSGHFVYGHIDNMATLENILSFDQSFIFTFSYPKQFSQYIISKGSITINGISLTVYEKVNSNFFKVMIIDHTYKNTNLQYLTPKSLVNIEFDPFGKYVENIHKGTDS